MHTPPQLKQKPDTDDVVCEISDKETDDETPDESNKIQYHSPIKKTKIEIFPCPNLEDPISFAFLGMRRLETIRNMQKKDL